MSDNYLNTESSYMSDNIHDKTEDSQDIFDNLKYICESTILITDSLQRGLDVAQMPNGDIVVTEIKTVNIQYVWSNEKQKMVRIGNGL